MTSSRATAAGSAQLGDAADGDGPVVVERVEYRQLDDGTLEAAVVYEVPETVTELEFRFERDYHEVVRTEGFERLGAASLSWDDPDRPTFAWDGETDAPRIVMRHEPTVGDPAEYAGGTDEWAVVLRPPTASRWRYEGAAPAFAYDAAVDGEGVAGERFLLLGEHELHETTVRGERVRLAVPAAAEPAAPPEEILATLADASRRLEVGERSDVVTVFAAPTGDVDWRHRGLSLGPDARVGADLRPDAAPSLWVHEYVHTRQDRSATTRETAWLVEATAEYYAAELPRRRGDVSFEEFRRVLAYGAEGPAAESVLAEPDTWRAQAQYQKGALVVAAIDRELREASGGTATFQDVLRAWNDAETFDGDAFAARVEALGGEPARESAVRLATTNATPSLWGRERHEAAFGAPAGSPGAGGTPAAGGSATGGADGGALADASHGVRTAIATLRDAAGALASAAGDVRAAGAPGASAASPALPPLEWLGLAGSALVVGAAARS